MLKLVTLYPWPTDPDSFRRHYLETHLPLCRAIPGLIRAQYAFEPQTIEGFEKWFCVFEGEFLDRAALDAALTTAEGMRAAADIPNFSPAAPTSIIYQMKSV